MKVLGLDGKQYIWNPTVPLTSFSEPEVSRECTSYHIKSRELLRSLFPTEKILEEVGLPGTRPMLFADFVVPLRKLIIEVHGEQHYKWVPYYHNTNREFLKSKRRDELKKSWCELNKLYYIELPYFEDINAWRNRVINFGPTNQL